LTEIGVNNKLTIIINPHLPTSEVINNSSDLNELFCDCGSEVTVFGTVGVNYKYNKETKQFDLVWTGNIEFEQDPQESLIFYCNECGDSIEHCDCKIKEQKID
jgi:hypothetical protein